MSIRERIEDAGILYSVGRAVGALLSTLVAVAATSRRRRPEGTLSASGRNKPMGDREAFEAFLADEMRSICGVVNYNILYQGKMHRIEHVFYKWLRCNLAHKAELPTDIRFDPCGAGGVGTAIASNGTLTLGHGWLGGLVDAVIRAPENADQFGTPSQSPLPIQVHNVGVIGGACR